MKTNLPSLNEVALVDTSLTTHPPHLDKGISALCTINTYRQEHGANISGLVSMHVTISG